MSDLLSSSAPGRYSWYHWRRWGFNFLTISIIAHLLFGVLATYLIVQTIQGKRKQTFAGPPRSANAPTRAIEHKVQMQKKQQTMSAPAPVKRITTTSNAKVALPAMPAMPRMNSAITPMAMAGMGGTGTSLGMGTGGGGTGGGSGGGGAFSLFGLRENKGGALVGTFFDFKQTPDQRETPIGKTENSRPTNEAQEGYKQAVTQYILGGMIDSTLTSRYFKGPNQLYTSQLFIPNMSSDEGPAAFNLTGRVRPSRWIVHYKGTVLAPDSGSYHFVGVADDVLVVRFNNQIVLDCGSMCPSARPPSKFYVFDGLKPDYGWFKGCGEGSAVKVEAGKAYPIDIVIGEWPGGFFRAYLQVRKDGEEYKKDSKGNPILPLFRTADVKATPPNGEMPVIDPGGPIWKAVAAPAALP